jgi:hypothetical protein
MHAIVRRYEGVDMNRTDEVTKSFDETLLPSLSKLPGFSGYFLIAPDNGVMTSIGLFESSSQSVDSTRIASEWVRDENLESVLPNAPKITDGEVIAHKTSNGFSA